MGDTRPPFGKRVVKKKETRVSPYTLSPKQVTRACDTMPAGTKLGAKWQLDAALLSRPVDLTALVSLSQTNPDEFFNDDTLSRMVPVTRPLFVVGILGAGRATSVDTL